MKVATAMKLAGQDAGKAEGTQTDLGDVLTLTRQAVSKWGEDIPELYEFKLRVLKPHWFATPRPRKLASLLSTKANGKARR